VLAATAARRGSAPALTFLDARLEATTYAFAELFEHVDVLAERFRARGLPADAPVGILLRSQEAQVLHYLAALRAGLVPSVLTPPSRKLDAATFAATIAASAEAIGFGGIVTDLDLQLAAPTYAPRSLEPTGAGTREPSVAASGLAFVQFSSGTTGLKKGVGVGNAAVLAQIDAYGRALGVHEDDVIVSWLPLYHDMGFIASLNLPLALGVHTVMLEPLDWVAAPDSYLHAVERHRATLGWHPNFAYAFMADRVRATSRSELSSLRALVNCSEPVTRRSQERFRERFTAHGLRAEVFHGCFAMAETTFALTHGAETDPGASDGDAVSVGAAIAGAELRAVRADGSEASEREVGELEARAPFLFDGYYGNPGATDAAVCDGWYRTGDLGYRVGDRWFVCGRAKDLIVVAGVNVHPHDVEEVVGALPGALAGRVSCFGERDEQKETERVVVIVESHGDVDEQAALRTAARKAILATFQIANFDVVVVPPRWLQKSSSGKIARSANREKWRAAA
jgi:fatty-acyl-CoA synthase